MKLTQKVAALGALFLTTGAIALAEPMAFAQSSPTSSPRSNSSGMQQPDRATRHQEMQAKIAQELSLTPDQITQSQAIHQQTKSQIAPLEQQLRQANTDLKALFASSTATESQIRVQYQQVQQVRQQVETIKLDGKISFWKILTADQKQKFGQMMASHERNHHRAN